MIDSEEILYRASEYCRRQGSELGLRLGRGYHGNVFSVDRESRSRQSAIKVHERERDYIRERDVYLRLQSHDVTSILEFDLPELLAYDDDLFAIEMTIVTPPFVLDFAGVYLDREPDFSEKVWAKKWRSERSCLART